MKKSKSVLWGILLVIVGVIWGLNAFDITDINIFFDGWWTLFIIVPCIFGLFDGGDIKGDIIGIIIGVLLFLGCRDIVNFNVIWKLIVPIILIIIGLSCIFKSNLEKEVKEKIKALNKNTSDKEYWATFSGQKVDLGKEEFLGCSATAVFGGIDIDLRGAKIKDDQVINVSAIFGGVNIVASKDINIKVNSTSIFGGVENRVKNNDDNKITVYVNATCLFGGVEIK